MTTSFRDVNLCILFQAIVQYHQWSTMSAREVHQLQKDLAELENGLTISDSTQQLRTELTNLRNKVRDFSLHFYVLFLIS